MENTLLAQKIDLLPVVRFKHIPRAFLVLVDAMLEAELTFNVQAYITGASYEDYPENGAHDKGFAWDIRIHDIVDKVSYVCFLNTRLQSVSERFRLVYGDPSHTDHVHVEYRVVDPE